MELIAYVAIWGSIYPIMTITEISKHLAGGEANVETIREGLLVSLACLVVACIFI